MDTITVTSPAPITAPRGAVGIAETVARVLNFFGDLIERRAVIVQRRTRAAEAAEVRRMANDVRKVDARFAADLAAAADRHEAA